MNPTLTWDSPRSMLRFINENEDKVSLVQFLDQYEENTHKATLIAFVQECLKADDRETMRDLLAGFQRIYRLGWYPARDDYTNPLFTIRACVEASIWNWPHSEAMDKVLVSYPHI